jgi:hypothetical protein
MTAAIDFLDIAPTYSFCGGSEEVVGNEHVEFDSYAPSYTPPQAGAYEVTPTSPAQTVWQMNITGDYTYRAFHISSLYPRVRWYRTGTPGEQVASG